MRKIFLRYFFSNVVLIDSGNVFLGWNCRGKDVEGQGIKVIT